MIFLFNRLSLWWAKNPTKGKICLALTTLHIFGLIFIIYDHGPKPPKKNQKILVRTIKNPSSNASCKITTSSTQEKQIPPPSAKKTSPIPKPIPKQPPIAPNKEPPAKKVEKKPTISKNTPPKIEKKKIPPKQIPSSSHNLEKSLKEIEETIAKIATNNDKMSSRRTKEIPSKLDPVFEELSLPLLTEEDYSSSLIEYLQDQLRLPDTGDVKIELTLRRDGSVESVKVLSAQSEKNRKRLEENLPKLQFPPFPKEEKEKKSKVFILTFCNDF